MSGRLCFLARPRGEEEEEEEEDGRTNFVLSPFSLRVSRSSPSPPNPDPVVKHIATQTKEKLFRE